MRTRSWAGPYRDAGRDSTLKAPQYGKSTVGPNTEKINKIKFYCLILCTTEPATETSWCWCWCCSCCGRAGSILRVGGIERDQVHVVDACVQTRPLECHHYRMAHCRSGHGEASVTQSNTATHLVHLALCTFFVIQPLRSNYSRIVWICPGPVLDYYVWWTKIPSTSLMHDEQASWLIGACGHGRCWWRRGTLCKRQTIGIIVWARQAQIKSRCNLDALICQG